MDVAGATDATLHLLHVVETAALGFDVRSALGDQLDERGNEILASAADVAGAASLTEVTTALAHGWAYREILSYVEDHDVGLVVAGTRGKTDFSRYTLGGVSSKLIRSSPAPVMVVRPPDEE
ncbi:MAG: universal stress protein [Salinigranum sp.]